MQEVGPSPNLLIMGGTKKVVAAVRPVLIAFGLIVPSALVAAEPAPRAEATVAPSQVFQLGGAAARAVPEIDLSAPPKSDTPAQRRLSLPLTLDGFRAEDVATMGPATIFMGEGLDEGREAVELGTYLSRGQARAGVSVTILEQDEELARSEVFVDYSVTENFSVGISGIFNELETANDTVPQIGLSAEYATEGGAFLQGGVADAPELDPVFGLSVGFRF